MTPAPGKLTGLIMVRRAAKLVAFLLFSASALAVLQASPVVSNPAGRILPQSGVRAILLNLLRK